MFLTRNAAWWSRECISVKSPSTAESNCSIWLTAIIPLDRLPIPNWSKHKAVLKRVRFAWISFPSVPTEYGISTRSHAPTPAKTTSIISETTLLKFFSLIATGFKICCVARRLAFSSLICLNRGGDRTIQNSSATSVFPRLESLVRIFIIFPSTHTFLNDWMKFLSNPGNAEPTCPLVSVSYESVFWLYPYKHLTNKSATRWDWRSFTRADWAVFLQNDLSYSLNNAVNIAGHAENPPRPSAGTTNPKRTAAWDIAYKNDQLIYVASDFWKTWSTRIRTIAPVTGCTTRMVSLGAFVALTNASNLYSPSRTRAFNRSVFSTQSRKSAPAPSTGSCHLSIPAQMPPPSPVSTPAPIGGLWRTPFVETNAGRSLLYQDSGSLCADVILIANYHSTMFCLLCFVFCFFIFVEM